MPDDRMMTWSRTRTSQVSLVRTAREGGQTILYRIEGDRSRVAGVPVPGQDTAAYWARVEALIVARRDHPAIAWPEEVLVCPTDHTTPLAFTMRLVPGRPLEELLLPAERQTLGLRWGRPEFVEIARMLCDVFRFTELSGFTQNDCHPGQYLVHWGRWSRKPVGVARVDTLAFSFHHQNRYFGTDAARWDYTAPELQKYGRTPGGLMGQVPGREADRFALGCLVFQLLTGASPTGYAGGELDLSRRVERREFAVISMPPGARVAPGVETAYRSLPPDLTALIERALVGSPQHRPTPDEFRQALAQVPSTSSITTRGLGLSRPSLPALAEVASGVGRLLVRHRWSIAGLGALITAIVWLPELPEAPADPAGTVRSAVPSVPVTSAIPATPEVARTSEPASWELITPPARRPLREDAHLDLNRKAGP